MQADYSKQLGDIAAALNHPATWWQNSWFLATFSAVLGVIGGFVGQFLLALFSDSRKKRKLRRMGYRYAAHLCVQLDQILTVMDDTSDHSIIPEALNSMAIDSPRAYMNSNHDLYSELVEKPCFELIFNRAEALLDPSKQTLNEIKLTQVMIIAQFVKHLAVGKIGGPEAQKTLEEIFERNRRDVEALTAAPDLRRP
jgi:hypothetical protein